MNVNPSQAAGRRLIVVSALSLAALGPAFAQAPLPDPAGHADRAFRAGIDAVIVPYKGSPAVIDALRAGEIDAAFEILGPTLGQIAGGAVWSSA